MLLNMQILKDGAIADGGLYVLIYWQFLLQRRLSDSIEQYNEPPRYRSYRNFAKSICVVQIYQTDAGRLQNLDRTGSDRIDKTRTESDRINKTWIGLRPIDKTRTGSEKDQIVINFYQKRHVTSYDQVLA